MAKLTVAQQKKLIRALPPVKLAQVKTHCELCQMQGKGIGDIVKSVGRLLSPIVKELGPVAIRELVIPFLKKKLSGGGLRLAGAGRPKKKRMKKR
jgi:hypothetical protein